MRIVIVEPHAAIREALRDLFRSEPGFEVTAMADLAALNAAEDLGSFDVAVVDERVAGAVTTTTRDAIKSLSKRGPVVVTGLGEPAYYEEAHVASGAVGYWPQDGDVERLIGLARATALVARVDRACAASSRRLTRIGRPGAWPLRPSDRAIARAAAAGER